VSGGLGDGLECVGKIPGKQFIDPVNRVLGDLG
jgi:hypothetical protein